MHFSRNGWTVFLTPSNLVLNACCAVDAQEQAANAATYVQAKVARDGAMARGTSATPALDAATTIAGLAMVPDMWILDCNRLGIALLCDSNWLTSFRPVCFYFV